MLACDVDDAATTLRAHRGQHRLAGKEGCSKVDLDQGREVCPGKRAERLAAADAGVVDQHIDASERIERGLDHRFSLAGQRKIGKPDDGIGRTGRAACCGDIGQFSFRLIGGEEQGEAFGGQTDCGFAADPARRAGHQGNLHGSAIPRSSACRRSNARRVSS